MATWIVSSYKNFGHARLWVYEREEKWAPSIVIRKLGLLTNMVSEDPEPAHKSVSGLQTVQNQVELPGSEIQPQPKCLDFPGLKNSPRKEEHQYPSREREAPDRLKLWHCLQWESSQTPQFQTIYTILTLRIIGSFFLLFFSYAPTICLTLLLGAGMGVLRAGKGLFICFSILRFSHSASSID